MNWVGEPGGGKAASPTAGLAIRAGTISRDSHSTSQPWANPWCSRGYLLYLAVELSLVFTGSPGATVLLPWHFHEIKECRRSFNVLLGSSTPSAKHVVREIPPPQCTIPRTPLVGKKLISLEGVEIAAKPCPCIQ